MFMPYVHFPNGQCAEALAAYAALFGATDLQVMRYADAPPGTPLPEGADSLVMHGQFSVHGGVFMASDAPPGYDAPQAGMSVMIAPATVAEAQRLYDALAEGGTVAMPFGPTFWSPGFGMVKDRFGTHWILGAQGV